MNCRYPALWADEQPRLPPTRLPFPRFHKLTLASLEGVPAVRLPGHRFPVYLAPIHDLDHKTAIAVRIRPAGIDQEGAERVQADHHSSVTPRNVIPVSTICGAFSD